MPLNINTVKDTPTKLSDSKYINVGSIIINCANAIIKTDWYFIVLPLAKLKYNTKIITNGLYVNTYKQIFFISV